MTKMVRIENADTSTYKIDVEVWQVGTGSDGGPAVMDHLIRTIHLDSPTQLITEYIHSGQYLVIKERVESERGAA